MIILTRRDGNAKRFGRGKVGREGGKYLDRNGW